MAQFRFLLFESDKSETLCSETFWFLHSVEVNYLNPNFVSPEANIYQWLPSGLQDLNPHKTEIEHYLDCNVLREKPSDFARSGQGFSRVIHPSKCRKCD